MGALQIIPILQEPATGDQRRKPFSALMNPTSSSIRFNKAPPTSCYPSTGVPHSGETAESIASYGARKVPRRDINVGDVVKAYAYMDSIFFAADVRCRLVDPTNLRDGRSLHEKKMLEHQGKLRKLRPCVVVGVSSHPGEGTYYILCPMAGFHEGGSRQPYEDLKEPASLLVRPVQTTHDNKTFGTYTAYRFVPEWRDGPQYLFPIEVSRRDIFVANRQPEQYMHWKSLKQLQADVKEVSNVWKKWRDAEHVVVEVDDNSQ